MVVCGGGCDCCCGDWDCGCDGGDCCGCCGGIEVLVRKLLFPFPMVTAIVAVPTATANVVVVLVVDTPGFFFLICYTQVPRSCDFPCHKGTKELCYYRTVLEYEVSHSFRIRLDRTYQLMKVTLYVLYRVQ